MGKYIGSWEVKCLGLGQVSGPSFDAALEMFRSLQFLMKIFENVNGTLNVIEDDLCECSAPIPPVLGEYFLKYHRH